MKPLKQIQLEVEKKAREIYLDRYASIGGKWEAVEESAKDIWRNHARKMILNDTDAATEARCECGLEGSRGARCPVCLTLSQ